MGRIRLLILAIIGIGFISFVAGQLSTSIGLPPSSQGDLIWDFCPYTPNNIDVEWKVIEEENINLGLQINRTIQATIYTNNKTCAQGYKFYVVTGVLSSYQASTQNAINSFIVNSANNLSSTSSSSELGSGGYRING